MGLSYPPGSDLSEASKTEMEAGSNTTKYASPAKAQHHKGVCKAWLTFNCSGTPAINGSNNVSSLTDNGVGDITVNFTTSFGSTSYATGGACRIASAAPNIVYKQTPNRATGSCRIRLLDGGSIDPTMADVVFFGAQ